MPVFSRVVAPYIPADVCDLIIDSADREDLSSLSLVSPTWKRRAQYRLFQEIYVVAGPRCILWYIIQAGDIRIPFPKILADTFQMQLSSLARIDPTLLGYVKRITFRGLSDVERRRALTLAMGYGDDPYLTLCVVQNFMNLLPNAHIIHLSHLIWTSCLRSLLLPNLHHCVRDTDKRDLTLISLTTIDHGRLHDSVFDILHVATNCRNVSASEIGWDHISLITDRFVRLRRPDIQEFTVAYPTEYMGTIVARRVPVMERLVTLNATNVSYSTYQHLHRMLKKSVGTLENLSLALGEESLSEDMWLSLELPECQVLKTVRLRLVICVHEPNDMCAGKEVLSLFVALLPPNVESITLIISCRAAPEVARQRIRTVPEWDALADALKKLEKLRSLTIDLPRAGLEVGYVDDPEDDPAFYAWKRSMGDLLKPAEVIFSTYSSGE